jgi:membrane-bound lytic murein transglycosylase D
LKIMPFKYMKTCALTLLFLGFLISGFTQDSQADDTSVAVKELVIITAGGSTPDHTVANYSSQALVKEIDLSSSPALLTLNPRAIPFVKDYLDDNEVRLMKMKLTGTLYFKLIDNIFQKYNLPTELKYLAVIESDLKSSATSWAGAVGPWQFMPTTGRLLGLTINKHQDDRRNLTKSTVAAAKYLKDLYAQLDDWLLVIAAYNGGPGRVESAIRKSGSRNFWDLQYYLPAESRTHVKKFIATHYIMEGQGGITTTGAGDLKRLGLIHPSQEILDNTLLQTITGKYSSMIIAKSLNMDIFLFNQLNPGFDAKVSIDSYGMKLPTDKMELFNARKMEILNESVQFQLMSSASTDENGGFPKEIKLPEKNTNRRK